MRDPKFACRVVIRRSARSEIVHENEPAGQNEREDKVERIRFMLWSILSDKTQYDCRG